jgi:hypothetical protein
MPSLIQSGTAGEYVSSLPIRQNRSIAFDLFFGLPYEKNGERSIYRSISRSIFMVQPNVH